MSTDIVLSYKFASKQQKTNTEGEDGDGWELNNVNDSPVLFI